MKLFRILKIIIDDKKYGDTNRDLRIVEINNLLGLNRCYFTDKLQMVSGNNYIVEYGRHPFWHDNKPITIKSIFNKYDDWHVMHWLCYQNGGKCGFDHSIVKGRFTKKYIYKWLNQQSKRMDLILEKHI